ncbi:MAG TPA: deaminase [Candidatus Aquilonibacter sp.]
MTERDDVRLLREAIELSRSAPPSQTAFSVGSLIARDGAILATGYSRERGPQYHAEQVALEKAAELGLDLGGATLYTSLEPCGARKSDPRACTVRILDAGIARVVFAMREPPVFVEGEGAEKLADAGVEVVELDAEASQVAQINAHLLTR